jgi:hypothetical protein
VKLEMALALSKSYHKAAKQQVDADTKLVISTSSQSTGLILTITYKGESNTIGPSPFWQELEKQVMGMTGYDPYEWIVG